MAVREGVVVRLRGSYEWESGESAEGEFKDNEAGELKGRFVYRESTGEMREYE
ncbi:MAG: hypothetical protein KDD45_10580 [Bdellovibrionales bacterium]|nr:hypothetical protein [Bdellovibrionales bacterium]